MEVNPRFGEDVSELDQLILRPAVGYKLNDHFTLWQGYAWVGNYQPSFREENRVYQQLLYRRKFPFVKVLRRTRLEERFIDNADGTAVRARTMLRGDFPLPDAPEWAIVIYEEIFVNVNAVGNGHDSGFDQNRLFLGMNRQFTEHFNVDRSSKRGGRYGHAVKPVQNGRRQWRLWSAEQKLTVLQEWRAKCCNSTIHSTHPKTERERRTLSLSLIALRWGDS
jgi:hypothetical protein